MVDRDALLGAIMFLENRKQRSLSDKFPNLLKSIRQKKKLAAHHYARCLRTANAQHPPPSLLTFNNALVEGLSQQHLASLHLAYISNTSMPLCGSGKQEALRFPRTNRGSQQLNHMHRGQRTSRAAQVQTAQWREPPPSPNQGRRALHHQPFQPTAAIVIRASPSERPLGGHHGCCV